jgi:hypothetical protein
MPTAIATNKNIKELKKYQNKFLVFRSRFGPVHDIKSQPYAPNMPTSHPQGPDGQGPSRLRPHVALPGPSGGTPAISPLRLTYMAPGGPGGLGAPGSELCALKTHVACPETSIHNGKGDAEIVRRQIRQFESAVCCNGRPATAWGTPGCHLTGYRDGRNRGR